MTERLNPNRSKSRDRLLKKFYIKLFVIGFIILLSGFVLKSVITFILRPEYNDPEYDLYQIVTQNISASSELFVEIGLSLFSISLFFGAITDKNISDNVKTGMMIFSGISILGLIIIFLKPSLCLPRYVPL